jgi:putative transposase
MPNYQTYSTSLKIYYSLGLQNQFVAKELRSQIPSSTSSAWKNSRFEHIIGSQLEKNIQRNLNEIQLLYHPKGSVPRKLATAQIRFILLLTSFFERKTFQKVLRRNKTQLINFIERFEDQVSVKQLSKILNISTKTFNYWKTQVKFKCDTSSLLLCVKRHPNQATISEVNVIKKWLSKPEFSHWGIHSIWALAFKQKETNLSKPAWYHYNKLLQIRKHAKKGRKPSYTSLKAQEPNQIWHADITVFKTLDGIKHYIYTVMDNYSRFIHSWRIEPIVSAKMRLETIQEAITNAFGENTFENLQLVTDGGPENDNQTIKEFINQSSINHTIALRDIVQSNSMMEAFYRTTKYQWLYLRKIEDGTQLNKEFESWINEYNNEKPHHALGIYTPHEILKGNDKQESFTQRMKLAAQKRREINKNASCKAKCNV